MNPGGYGAMDGAESMIMGGGGRGVYEVVVDDACIGSSKGGGWSR